MTVDIERLEVLAKAASQGSWNQDGFDVQNDDTEDYRVSRCNLLADAKFIAAANPAAVLALIAENERLTKAVGLQVIRRFVGDDDQKNIDELVAAGIQVDKELIVQLKAENERLAAACERAEQIIIVECKAASLAKVRANLLEANRDQLRAEVAGLRTGYEAYERVNAELKAEVEGLRKALADILDLYDTDEGCRNLPQYIVGRAALGQGEKS